MNNEVTSAETTASAVMKISVLRRCREKVTGEIRLSHVAKSSHLAQEIGPALKSATTESN
jgi:hypothetical protein